MPKVTDEYITNEFMRRFAKSPREKRIGTIHALKVCDQVMAATESAQTSLLDGLPVVFTDVAAGAEAEAVTE